MFFTFYLYILQGNHIYLSGFNFRMIGDFIEMFGNLLGQIMKRKQLIKVLTNKIKDLIQFQLAIGVI